MYVLFCVCICFKCTMLFLFVYCVMFVGFGDYFYMYVCIEMLQSNILFFLFFFNICNTYLFALYGIYVCIRICLRKSVKIFIYKSTSKKVFFNHIK